MEKAFRSLTLRSALGMLSFLRKEEDHKENNITAAPYSNGASLR
jgi:hypothetical protein